jgi:hypothetical protein
MQKAALDLAHFDQPFLIAKTHRTYATYNDTNHYKKHLSFSERRREQPYE